MQATPVRAQALADNLRVILARINAVASTGHLVRLVAVSKLKPVSDVLALYNETGHRHMGENYVQELLEKARVLPREIEWHFIGQLQTNKCRKLAEEIPNLWAVESVDTSKKADALEKGRATLTATSPDTPKLRVYVQVNTSGEAAKSGCAPSETIEIARHIKESCPHLSLQGVMTIGSIVRSQAKGEENQDFLLLNEMAKTVERELGVELELSMGMSNDFEEAIQMGARNVRIGTAIFGQRPPKPNETAKD
ncbi:hypothetical protein K440DRAFT_653361 [Wilcoxina mikolae CBS 423.85]|nr:hypothetical protein K440DRAFT_653361 [Wilcoxina mikolae CBS 423.85]